MAREGTLAPESFINPSLPLEVQWPVMWAQWRAAEAGLLGARASDPLLAGRALSATAGAVAVLLTGLAAARVRPDLAVLAAALLAVAPGVVNLCHFATPEPWLLLTTAGAMLVAFDCLQGRRGPIALGLALGLAAGTKYTAAALAVPCLLAIWLSSRSREPRRGEAILLAAAGGGAIVAAAVLLAGPGAAVAAGLHLADMRLLHPESASAFVRSLGIILLAGGLGLAVLGGAALAGARWGRTHARVEVLVVLLVAGAAFVVGTPYAVVHPRAFLSDLAFNQQTRQEYKGLVGASTSFGPYLALLADALTGPLAVTALIGLLLAVVHALGKDRALAVLAAFAVAPYLLVASSGHQAMRFLVPCFPPVAILAALVLRALPAARARLPLTALVLARAALATILVLRLFFVDARYAAARWIEAHVPEGVTVDLIANNPGYGPALPEGRLRVVPTLSREMAPRERFREAAAAYRAEAAPWLVLTASYYERFLDHPDQAPERAAFFRDLLEGRGGFAVAARFRQEGWRRPSAEFLDPEIVVLRRTSGDQLPMR